VWAFLVKITLNKGMQGFQSFITEAIETWFHGSDTKIDKFTLDNVGRSEAIDQEGPGIYITTSADDARRYGRYIHQLAVKTAKTRLMPDKKRFDPSLIRRLILKSPDRDDALTNWDENPHRALNIAVDQIYSSYGPDEYREAMESIWGDFYRNHPKEYLKALWQWDGFILPRADGVRHMIVFKPDIIKVISVIDKNTGTK